VQQRLCAQAAPPPVVFSARTDKILGEELDANTRGIVHYDVVAGPTTDNNNVDAGATPSNTPAVASAAAPAATETPVTNVPTPVDVAIEKVLAPAMTSKEVRFVFMLGSSLGR
jgi:hypothetical protein